MAKNKKSRKRPIVPVSAAGLAVAGGQDEGEGFEPPAEASGPLPLASSDGAFAAGGADAASMPGSGFFSVYKGGQGYYTRLGTAIGGAVILILGAHYLYTRLEGTNPAVQLGVPSVFLAATGLVLFWLAGSNRRTNDFFIATEGEMKKVSWSTRGEVIGSTKVVLAFTLVVAVFLFVVDVLFLLVFSALEVLKIPIEALLGLG